MRTGIYFLLGTIGIALVVVMLMAVMSMSDVGRQSEDIHIDNTLESYLPLEPSVWEYSNNETFRKLMVTEEVYRSDKFTNVIVKGQEDDSSIKSYRDKYQFEYVYKADDEKIVRTLKGNVLIDPYVEITLLQKPLEKGHSWTDSWTALDNQTYSIKSTIEDILDDGNQIVVKSVSKDNAFTIIRILEKDKGVVQVLVQETYDDIDFETGFQLLNFKPFEYEGFDNYMALLGNEKIGTVIEPIAETADEATYSSSNDTTSEETSHATDESENILEASQIQEDDEIDLVTKEAIIQSVQLFNDKWIDFINTGDMSIMEATVPGGSVEKIIQAYMNKNMTQQFLAMEFNKVVVKGTVANVYAYEEIERTMNGVTEVLIYNWIYEVDNIDGVWLVEGYIENKTP